MCADGGYPPERNLRKSSFTSTQVELDALFFKVGSVAGHAGLELFSKLSPISSPRSLPPNQAIMVFAHKYFLVAVLTEKLGFSYVSCLFGSRYISGLF